MNCSSQGFELSIWLVTIHEPWPLTLCRDSWADLKGLTLWFEQRGVGRWVFMNKPSLGQDVWRDVSVHLQEAEAVLTGFHLPAHEALTRPGNQEADALAWVPALVTDPSVVSSVDGVHRKGSHRSTRVGWRIAKTLDCPRNTVSWFMQQQRVSEGLAN